MNTFNRFAIAASLTLTMCAFLIALVSAIFANYKNITLATASEKSYSDINSLTKVNRGRLSVTQAGKKLGHSEGLADAVIQTGVVSGKNDIQIVFDDFTQDFDPLKDHICIFSLSNQQKPDESVIYRASLTGQSCKINFAHKDQTFVKNWNITLQLASSNQLIEKKADLEFSQGLVPDPKVVLATVEI